MPLRLLSILYIPIILAAQPLGAQENDKNPGVRTEPRLAGIVDLSSLSFLWGTTDEQPIAVPEPLDIAATAGGPVLLFSDRVLSLGINLEMTTRTIQDLATLPRLPSGVVPARLLLNPLTEPIIYDGQTGALHLLHRDGSDPELFKTGLPQAPEIGSLRQGGVLLSGGNRLILFTRRANELSRREVSLPSPFTTGLSVDDQDGVWVYDLTARKARRFDLNGQELSSITPAISGGTLLFPQVFQARADGGFFLGTAGQLWCFAADGSVRWRLAQFSVGYRQSLPAFYRLADGGGSTGGEATGDGPTAQYFYILDPLGNRIMKFTEDPGKGPERTPAIDRTLAAAFRSPETLQSRQNEILRLCLEKELYLQAAFFRRNRGDEPLITDLPERIREKQARLMADLAGQLENQLRFPEAEAAYNRSLSLYRELRNLDPVDPRYPKAVRDLSKRRNGVRRILVAEPLLTTQITGNAIAFEGTKQRLSITLTNSSASTVEEVEVFVRFSGYTASSWQASLGTLPAGRNVLLSIPLWESGGGVREEPALLNNEDLSLPCNLLVWFELDRQKTAQYFHLPLLFPAGSLHLPTHN
jgi:hypothetical protein